MFQNVDEEAVEEALAVEGVDEGAVEALAVVSVGEEEDGAAVEEVERAGLREKPIPKGGPLVFSLALTKKQTQWVKMRVAKKRHIPAGYAAMGAVLKPPFAFCPIMFCLCLLTPVCPQLSGSGPV